MDHAELEALLAEARDPETSFERLVELLPHLEPDVRRVLLDHPNLCPADDQGQFKTDLLEYFAQQFPGEVANVPVFVLHVLIEPNDEFEGVVREVVKRTADVGLIEQILRTWGPSSGNVRYAVAKNPNTPVDLLRTLGNPATEPKSLVRQVVATTPRAPEDVLRTLGNEATEVDWMVRREVAINPTTPEDVLRILSNPETELMSQVREAAKEMLEERGLA